MFVFERGPAGRAFWARYPGASFNKAAVTTQVGSVSPDGLVGSLVCVSTEIQHSLSRYGISPCKNRFVRYDVSVSHVFRYLTGYNSKGFPRLKEDIQPMYTYTSDKVNVFNLLQTEKYAGIATLRKQLPTQP
jgi:hypothetical protein